eukprot:g56930.t1
MFLFHQPISRVCRYFCTPLWLRLQPPARMSKCVLQIDCVTVDLPACLAGKVELEIMKGNSVSVNLPLVLGGCTTTWRFPSIAAAMLGLAQGAVAQSQDCRYIAQVTTPQTCMAEYSGNVDLDCSFGARLANCPVTAASPSRSPSPTSTSSTPSTSAASVSSTPSAMHPAGDNKAAW